MNKGLLAAREAPRCGARTRHGKLCARPAANGTARCPNHGGGVNAKTKRGSGAPKGNTNALKHGVYTAEALRERKGVMRMIKVGRDVVKRMAG